MQFKPFDVQALEAPHPVVVDRTFRRSRPSSFFKPASSLEPLPLIFIGNRLVWPGRLESYLPEVLQLAKVPKGCVGNPVAGNANLLQTLESLQVREGVVANACAREMSLRFSTGHAAIAASNRSSPVLPLEHKHWMKCSREIACCSSLLPTSLSASRESVVARPRFTVAGAVRLNKGNRGALAHVLHVPGIVRLLVARIDGRCGLFRSGLAGPHRVMRRIPNAAMIVAMPVNAASGKHNACAGNLTRFMDMSFRWRDWKRSCP